MPKLLSDEKVWEIYTIHLNTKRSIASIADDYGVSKQYIYGRIHFITNPSKYDEKRERERIRKQEKRKAGYYATERKRRPPVSTPDKFQAAYDEFMRRPVNKAA